MAPPSGLDLAQRIVQAAKSLQEEEARRDLLASRARLCVHLPVSREEPDEAPNGWPPALSPDERDCCNTTVVTTRLAKRQGAGGAEVYLKPETSIILDNDMAGLAECELWVRAAVAGPAVVEKMAHRVMQLQQLVVTMEEFGSQCPAGMAVLWLHRPPEADRHATAEYAPVFTCRVNVESHDVKPRLVSALFSALQFYEGLCSRSPFGDAE